MHYTTAKDHAKDLILQYLTSQFNVKSPKKNFRCLSGTHEDKNPSMSYDKARQRVRCFSASCNADYDIFDLYAIRHNLSLGSRDAFEGVYEWARISVDKPSKTNDFISLTNKKPATSEEQIDYHSFFTKAQSNLSKPECIAYLSKRGISEATAKQYGLGYVEDWQSPKALKDGKNPPNTPRLIIPTSECSYTARDIRDNIPVQQQSYAKMKEGSTNIFNIKVLEGESPCFVTEGEIDALSFLELGYNAIALGSASNTKSFVEKLKALPKICPLILALDNDKSGKDAKATLERVLSELGIEFSCNNELYDCHKDANEFLKSDQNSFKNSIEETLSTAIRAQLEETEIKKSEYLNESASNYVSLLRAEINASRNIQVISTGFNNLNKVLGGGLFGGLYIIGAISSLGKTTLAIQIADHISSQGQDVLYISLEMSRYEIMAKSISKHTFLYTKEHKYHDCHAKFTRNIMIGSKYVDYSNSEREVIYQAGEAYKKEAERLWIVEGLGNIGATKIRELVVEHIKYTGNSPVVIVDYLQILAPYEKLTEKQSIDKTVLELKRISRDFKTPVLAISSFNRQNYATEANMTAFKESGGIEYSADVLIGLQLKGASDSKFDVDAAKKKEPREVELKILKNRNGETGTTLDFKYDARFNYFSEVKNNKVSL